MQCELLCTVAIWVLQDSFATAESMYYEPVNGIWARRLNQSYGSKQSSPVYSPVTMECAHDSGSVDSQNVFSSERRLGVQARNASYQSVVKHECSDCSDLHLSAKRYRGWR